MSLTKHTYNTVFIIDDNATSNLVHKHVLARIAITETIQTFTNPVEGLDQLRTELLDPEKRILVLLDIHMPEMNGFEFLDACSCFTEKHEVLDILMVTSSIDDRELQLGTEYTLVKKVISKPLKGNQILEFITQNHPVSA